MRQLQACTLVVKMAAQAQKPVDDHALELVEHMLQS